MIFATAYDTPQLCAIVSSIMMLMFLHSLWTANDSFDPLFKRGGCFQCTPFPTSAFALPRDNHLPLRRHGAKPRPTVVTLGGILGYLHDTISHIPAWFNRFWTSRSCHTRSSTSHGNARRYTAVRRLSRGAMVAIMAHQQRVSHSSLMACHAVTLAAASSRAPRSQMFDSDSYTLAIDNCCSRCMTSSLDDFIGNPTPIASTVRGIGGNVPVLYKGTVKWTFDDDTGAAHTFMIPDTYYNPDTPYRLLSPQHWAQTLRRGKAKDTSAQCTTTADQVHLSWGNGEFKRTVKLDQRSNVAIMESSAGCQNFNAFCAEVAAVDDHTLDQCVGCVTIPVETGELEISTSLDNETNAESHGHPDLPAAVFTNQKGSDHFLVTDELSGPTLSPEQKMLAWHYRLGHLSFEKMKAMIDRGDLPSELKGCQLPKCAACMYAKAQRRPWRVKGQGDGMIKKDASFPGALVSVDQMVSQTPGLVAQMAGFLTGKRYVTATVFVDVYSNLSFVFLQKTQTAVETLEAKQAFERYAQSFGVSILNYRTDNGIFAAEAFTDEIHRSEQTITMSGVGAHHQNGVAEQKIRYLQDTARAMLLHAQHRWDDAITPHLWPYALRMASEMANFAPDPQRGVSPIERFSGVNVAPKVKHSHVFGSPVYVLDSKLQTSGSSVPKWQARSRVGIYLGSSPRHSKRVALVLNMATGHVSPQFHVAYDDLFETVRRSAGNVRPQSLWQLKSGLVLDGQSSAKGSRTTHEGESGSMPAADLEWAVSEKVSTEGEYPPQVEKDNGNDPYVDGDEAGDPTQQDWSDDTSSIPFPSPTRTASPATPARSPSRRNTGVVTRAGRRVRATQRWLESQEQQRDGIVSLYVSWEVFNDGGYQIQDEMDDPIAFAASNDPDIMYVTEALKAPDRKNFVEAMLKEVAAHTDNDHWEIVPVSSVPEGVKVLPSVWAMRRKRRIATGEIYKWKARLNLHGGKQEKGVNFWETYAPVVSWTTIRLFLVMTLLNGYASRQIDFVLAYPQAEIEVPMYMELPYAFDYKGDRKSHCLLLKRNLYGQKQAGRVWNQYLHDGLIARGFVQSSIDMCLYYRGPIALLIYTDDGIIIGPTSSDIDEIVEIIKNPVFESGTETFRSFNITDEGSISDYLGVKVDHLENGTIKLSQPSLTKSILADLGFNERTKGKASPAASTIHLHRDEHGKPYDESWHYRSIIGKLNFLEKSTRPDIAYAVHQCARFCTDPKESHASAVKHIGKYLLSTQDKGLILCPQDHSFDCFVDADFVGNWNRNTAHVDPMTAKSRSAWIIRYAACPIAWASKLQTDVALSSTEAEYTAMSESLRQVIHMIQLVEEAKVLGWKTFVGTPTVHCKVFEDNSGALEIARLPKMRPRTKHLCTRLHHFREYVRLGKISIQHITTRMQLADIATKPQPEELFIFQRDLIMNWKAEHARKEDLSAITFNQLVACDISQDPTNVVLFQLDWQPLAAIDEGSYELGNRQNVGTGTSSENTTNGKSKGDSEDSGDSKGTKIPNAVTDSFGSKIPNVTDHKSKGQKVPVNKSERFTKRIGKIDPKGTMVNSIDPNAQVKGKGDEGFINDKCQEITEWNLVSSNKSQKLTKSPKRASQGVQYEIGTSSKGS